MSIETELIPVHSTREMLSRLLPTTSAMSTDSHAANFFRERVAEIYPDLKLETPDSRTHFSQAIAKSTRGLGTETVALVITRGTELGVTVPTLTDSEQRAWLTDSLTADRDTLIAAKRKYEEEIANARRLHRVVNSVEEGLSIDRRLSGISAKLEMMNAKAKPQPTSMRK